MYIAVEKLNDDAKMDVSLRDPARDIFFTKERLGNGSEWKRHKYQYKTKPDGTKKMKLHP